MGDLQVPQAQDSRSSEMWPLEIKSGSSVVTIYRITIGDTIRHQLSWFESGEVKRRTITDEESAKVAAQEQTEKLDAGEHATLISSALEAEEYRQKRKVRQVF